MHKKNTTSNPDNQNARNLIRAVVIALAVTVIGCTIGAWMISGQVLAESSASTLSLVVLLLATFAGGLTSGRYDTTGNWLVVLLFSGIYAVILLVMHLFLFDANLGGLWQSILTILIGTGTSIWVKERFGKHRNKGMKKMKQRKLYKVHN